MFFYVYSITNKLNNKSYVGKTNDLKRRWSVHCRGKLYIGNTIRKYGKENFLYQILEKYSTENEAYEAEKFFIQYLGTRAPFGYNLNGGGKGGLSPSEETKKKISQSNKGKVKGPKNNSRIYNVDLSDPDGNIFKGPIDNLWHFCKDHNIPYTGLTEVISGKARSAGGWTIAGNPKKISRNQYEDTVQKISLSLKGKVSWSKTWHIKLIDPNGNEYGPITNLKKFAREHGHKDDWGFRSLAHGIKKQYKGWTCKNL